MALKESLKNAIREDAQSVCNFNEDVNNITFEKAGIGSITADANFVVDRMMGDICDRIIDSRMAMVDKECILSTMFGMLKITKMGTELDLMSDEERKKLVEEEAENYIIKNKHIAEKFNSKKFQRNN
jgi:hypothetical protein